MTAAGERGARRLRRLLRWYPRSWRERDGDVLVATFEERAEHDGGPLLRRGDAWSVRAHGLAERLSPTAGLVLAAIGTAVEVLGVLAVAVGEGGSPAHPVAVFALAPTLLTFSGLALLLHLRVVGAARVLLVAALAPVGWLALALAVLSWGEGFRQRDAGLPVSPFAAAMPVLGLLAVALGAVCLAVVGDALLRRVRPLPVRWFLAAAIALVALVVAAVVLVLGAGLLAGPALVIVWVWLLRAGPRLRVRPPRPARSSRPVREVAARGADRRHDATVLAVVSAVAGAPFACYALLGEPAGLVGLFLPEAPVQERMNAGLAGGAVAALPLVVALGLLAGGRWGRRGAGAAALLGAAVVLGGVSAALGPVGDTQFWLVVTGGVLLGVAAVLPWVGLVPGPALARVLVAAVVAVGGGLALGITAVAAFPLYAPLLSAGLAVALLARRGRRADRPVPNHATSAKGAPAGAIDVR